MNEAAPKPDLVDPTASQTEADLLGLSKRLTQRAAASLAQSDPKPQLGRLSLEAEADHINALRRYIISKEAVVVRFREQLARFPIDIAILRDRMSKETDTAVKTIISKNLEAYAAMQDTLTHRVQVFEATWPSRKAEMQAAIDSHEKRLADETGPKD